MSNESRLLKLIPNLSEKYQGVMLTLGDKLLENMSDDDDDNLPAPKRPGRPRKAEANNSAPAKRGRGRPRTRDIEDAEAKPRGGKRSAKNNSRDDDDDDMPAKRGRGRPRKDNSQSAPNKRSTARSTPAARSNGAVDYSEMSKSELRTAAEKMKLDTKAAKIADANLAKALAAIDKLANGSKSVESWERQAEKAGVELVFGAGRPPATDEGKKRRIIAKMVSARALRV